MIPLVPESASRPILGIPDDRTQVALVPVAYFTGEDFTPAKRLGARQRTYWERWGAQGRGIVPAQ